MKKVILKVLCTAIISMSVLSLCGCGNNAESSQPETTVAPTQAIETTVSLDVPDDFDIGALHSFDKESTDPFAGVWHITDGNGSELSGFSYIFDGNGNAKLMVDNMGYLGSYTKEAKDGTETFTCQLMFGINGTYTFKFENDGKRAVLTDITNNAETILEKLENYSYVPEKPEELKLDENLIGAWKSEEGMYYYFGKDGIMYSNTFGAMFTCFSYSAENGKVAATYTMDEKITENYEYSLNGDKLVFDNLVYTKIPVTDLI